MTAGANLFLQLLGEAGVKSAPAKTIRAVGIDLGTTNSTISEVVWNAEAGAPEAVRTLDVDQKTPMGLYTHVLVPSMVCLKGRQVWVGEGAKQHRGKMSEPRSDLRRNKNIFWECKNQMGETRTYHLAPKGYRSAAEIGGHVLKFLMDAAARANDAPAGSVAVTVPASFRVPQRQDTQKAAQLAGIQLQPGALVDEPIAAFLDYIFSHDISMLKLGETPRNLLVFDFGGGTCDVAIFQVSIPAGGGSIRLAPKAVSRYHRLGGGDIDLAVFHEILIPQILEQNKLTPFDLTYEDKAHILAPAFLSVAESLKIGICKEMSKQIELGRYASAEDKKSVGKRMPGVYECQLKDGRTISLQAPSITALQFEKLMLPFLDRDFLFARETEYRMTCSIFAPLTDALQRAGLEAEDIHCCLMAGSSSFIPQIQEAADAFFANGFVLNFASAEDAKIAVSRGAAYHALAVALTGSPLVRPIAGDSIRLETKREPLELVPAGAQLPYPAEDQWAEVDELTIPETSKIKPLPLKLSLVSGDGLLLFNGIWEVPPPLEKGQKLRFLCRMDQNQTMWFRVSLAASPQNEFEEYEIENPLTNIHFPDSRREEIEELEEKMRTGQIPRKNAADTVFKIAKLTSELGQRERALDLMKKALAEKGGRDLYLLNQMGILCGELRDFERQEKFYLEAAKYGEAGAPLFNLALSKWKQGLIDEGIRHVEAAMGREKDPAYLVLRSILADAKKDPIRRDAWIKESIPLFGSVSKMSDFHLGWYMTAAGRLDDKAQVQAAQEEQKKRRTVKAVDAFDGFLPDRGES